MAAKRGKGGKFVKSGGKGKGKKRRRSSSGTSNASALLKSINKKVTRIDHTVNAERWGRIKGKKRARHQSRHEEAELSAKYG